MDKATVEILIDTIEDAPTWDVIDDFIDLLLQNGVSSETIEYCIKRLAYKPAYTLCTAPERTSL